LLGKAEASAQAPPCWRGAPDAGDGTLIRVSCWVSALPAVLDAVDAAARDAGVSPAMAGSAGAGVLYLQVGPDVAAGAAAGFVRALRAALAGQRGGVVVLATSAAVREALSGYGGMAGAVPSLALMRAVKDQFDPGHRMAPGRFPEVM
jgi:glycolate oxidase FAD binding subunit